MPKADSRTPTIMSSKISIDIVSDVACPWCYIGKKNLENALQQLPNQAVEINWHPFQLDPTIPEEGISREEYFTKKFGDSDRVQVMFERVESVGKNVGINFDFNKMPKAVNTIPLHKMLNVAREEGTQHALEEHLFKAYFEQGVDFSNKTQLLSCMEAFGWNNEKVEGILANDEISYWVTQEIKHFQSMGISGVPFFIINNKYGLSGAQPADVFVQAISKAAEELKPAVAVGESCDLDNGNC